MVERVSGFALARIDGWGLVDRGDRPPRKAELADEFGEPDWAHGDVVRPRGDTQQQIGDHRGEDLRADRVVIAAEEVADIEMLFDLSGLCRG